MIKYELIRAIMELQNLRILTPAMAFNCIKQVVDKTITGTYKNFKKISENET